MDEKELIESTCFKIISAVGTAKSQYIQAIKEAKNGSFEKADELIKEGAEIYLEGHRAHFQLLQQETSGKAVIPTLMLMHAEDQLITADGFKIIAQDFIEVYKKFYNK